MEHKTFKLNINGEMVNIDCKMKNLIKEMNKSGIRTMACCQGNGEGEDYDKRYVMFDFSNINSIEIYSDGQVGMEWSSKPNKKGITIYMDSKKITEKKNLVVFNTKNNGYLVLSTDKYISKDKYERIKKILEE